MTRIPFDADSIQALATILRDNGLTEIELRDGDTHLRLQKSGPVAAAPAPMAPAPQPTPASAPAESGTEPPPPAGAVPSPMVGIAYLSADPASAPFITVGVTVTAGQTLLLIEAMKTFNQIKAPHAGTVTQILVSSGQPVEYGQPLVVIA